MKKCIIGMLAIALVCMSSSTAVAKGKGEPISVIGAVEVLQSDDFDAKKSELHHVIVDEKQQKAYTMRLDAATRKTLRTGMRVKVDGHLINDELAVTNDSGSITPLSTVEDEAAAAGANAIAVIIVNFQDSAVTGSPDQIASVMFGDPANPDAASVADYYFDSSFGQFTFAEDSNGDNVQDVFGPYTISYHATDPLNYYGWAYEAEALAEAAGVDLSPFQHRLFVVPSNTTAPWWGIANVGISNYTGFARAWITQWNQPDLYAHELGHNLFLRHAATDRNNDGVVEETYGDLSCIMGYSGVGYRELNAPHKVQMGWFDAYPEKMEAISEAGTYYVAPLEMNPWETSLPQVLTFYKQDSNEYYYLSYRIRMDYDAGLNSDYANGLSIHKHTGGAVETKFITTLGNGASFEDTANAFLVTQVSYDPDPVSGYVEITLNSGTGGGGDPGECPATQHSSRISIDSVTAAAGETVNYAVSITNHDAAGCDASIFTVTPVLPEGWTASSDQLSLTVAANDTETAIYTVTAPTDAAGGSYAVDARVEAEDGLHGTTYHESVWTIEPQTPPPTVGLAPGNFSSYAGESTIFTVTVTNNDSIGSDASTFTVTPAVPVEWSCTPVEQSVTVDPGETSTVDVTVSAPSDVATGSYVVSALVTSTSAEHGSQYLEAVWTILDAIHPPTASLSPSSTDSVAGEAKTFTVSVTNNDASGSNASTFTITPGIPAGWSSSFGEQSITIAPGSTDTVNFTVTPPSGTAAGAYVVSALVTSSTAEHGSQYLEADWTILDTTHPPTTIMTPLSIDSYAGDSRNFTISVTNNDGSGSGASTFTVTPTVPAGWSSSLNQESITLDPGSTGTLSFTVTAASSAATGMYAVTASVTSSNGQHGTQNLDAAWTILTPPGSAKPHSSRISLNSVTAEAGETVNYAVSVTNHDDAGSTASVFTVTPVLPEGWTASSTHVTLTIAASDTETALFTVTAPADAAAGTYAVDALVESADGLHGTTYHESVWTIENTLLTVSLSPTTANSYTGESKVFTVSVSNYDTSDSTFTITPTVPTGWTSTVDQQSITVASGASEAVNITVTAPSDAAAGTYAIQAVVTSSNALHDTHYLNAEWTVNSPVTTAKPHSSRISMNSVTAEAGATVNYAVSVTNHDPAGNTPSIFTVTPVLPEGWTASSEQIVLTIAASETETALYTITAPADAVAGSYAVDALVESADGLHGTTYHESVWTIEATLLSVDLSPGSTDSVAGESNEFTVSVTNNDASASTYTIAPAVPTDWISSIDQHAITVAPGATGTVSFTVTAPSNVAAGAYVVSVLVTSSTPAHGSQYLEAVWTIIDTTIPPMPHSSRISTNSVTAGAGETVNYAVSVTNHDAAGDASVFTVTPVLPDGWTASSEQLVLTVAASDTETALYTITAPADAPAGSYAVDALVESVDGLHGTTYHESVWTITTTP